MCFQNLLSQEKEEYDYSVLCNHILYSLHISEFELVTLFTEISNIPYKRTLFVLKDLFKLFEASHIICDTWGYTLFKQSPPMCLVIFLSVTRYKLFRKDFFLFL